MSLAGGLRGSVGVAIAFGVLIGPAWASAVTLEWVTVGHADNPPDALTGRGHAYFSYEISKHEITNAQYAEFLQAVAADDLHGLFDANMGITRSGVAGSYTYAAAPGFENKPVVYVSLLNAVRFVNWLGNGQPSGAQDWITTENGTYEVTLEDGSPSLNYLSRNGGYAGGEEGSANYFLPSVDEWYKAAYFDPDSENYFLHPARSDLAPGCVEPANDTGNSENCASSGLTDVGAYGLSASPLGTFDQGGNAAEWTESIDYTCSFGPPAANVVGGGSFIHSDSSRSHASSVECAAHYGVSALQPIPWYPWMESSSSLLGFRVGRNLNYPCVNGLDDDGDGRIDYLDDPACAVPTYTERSYDQDGDGIASAIDGRFVLGSFVYEDTSPSTDFTDQGTGGTTFGSIQESSVTGIFENLPDPAGVLVAVPPWRTGSLRVRACLGNAVSVLVGPGTSTDITCSSLHTKVVTGVAQLLLGIDVAVSAPAGTTVTVADVGLGQFQVDNAAGSVGPISVITTANSAQLAPGSAQVVTPQLVPASALRAMTISGELLAVDSQTAADALLAQSTLDGVQSIERVGSGAYYAIAAPNLLYRIDPATGQALLVAPVSDHPIVKALAWDATRLALFASASANLDGQAERLVRIDPRNATATVVGPFGAGFSDVSALAASPSGVLVAASGLSQTIGRVNPMTGAALSSLPIPSRVEGLDYEPGGMLFGVALATTGPGPSTLLTFAPGTGPDPIVGLPFEIGSISSGSPATSVVAGGAVADCGDGVDDDGDGAIDLTDPGCVDATDVSERSLFASCDDGVDNDGDGAIDFPLDRGCQSPTGPRENTQCQNGIDDDHQPGLDFDGGASRNAGVPLGAPDPECLGKPWRDRETQGGCGLGAELAVLLPALWRLRRRHAVRCCSPASQPT